MFYFHISIHDYYIYLDYAIRIQIWNSNNF